MPHGSLLEYIHSTLGYHVSLSVWAALTKVPQTGWLKQQTFISHCSRGCEVQDQGAGRVRGLVRAHFMVLSSFGVFTWQEALWCLFYEGTNAIHDLIQPHDLITF